MAATAQAPTPTAQVFPTGNPLSATPSQSSSSPLQCSGGPLLAQSGSAQSTSPSQSSSFPSPQTSSDGLPAGQAQLPSRWHCAFEPHCWPRQSGSAQSARPSQSSSSRLAQAVSLLAKPPGQLQPPP